MSLILFFQFTFKNLILTTSMVKIFNNTVLKKNKNCLGGNDLQRERWIL